MCFHTCSLFNLHRTRQVTGENLRLVKKRTGNREQKEKCEHRSHDSTHHTRAGDVNKDIQLRMYEVYSGIISSAIWLLYMEHVKTLGFQSRL